MGSTASRRRLGVLVQRDNEGLPENHRERLNLTYSPECLEDEFCEIRLYGVLRSCLITLTSL